MAAMRVRRDSITSRTSDFQHEPLDYTRGAIRLLKVLPDLSRSGLIQCEIWHDMVSAKYTCLSYVWGSEALQEEVLINGKRCWVRENLWNFMRVARTKYANPPRTFWVDALCIDQGSVLEKNHQVAQMGSIYSKAIEVITWLGFNQSIGRALASALELDPDKDYWKGEEVDWWIPRNDQTNGQLKQDWLTLIRDRYWSRAWIAQEILLARQIKVLVNDFEIEPRQIYVFTCALLSFINDLPGNERANIQDWEHREDWDHRHRIFSYYIYHMCTGPSRGSRLISLLADLPGRQSYYVHDRVYSLLSLATDASRIKVDYNASTGELLNQLLEIYSTTMCICSWFYIIDMLEVHHIPDPRYGGDDRVPVFKIPMRPDQTNFIMLERMEDWHHACKTCSARMDSFDPSAEITFCIKSLCKEIPCAHLYVKKHRPGKYTIRRSDDTTSYDVVHFQPAKLEPEDGLALSWGSCPELYDIFLTGDVVMGLLYYPSQEARSKLPLHICRKARRGDKRMEFCGDITARAR
ncbi:HET-domain-containing protein [Pyrenophora teres f. teres]|uniref:HET-domain-containing protein n=1 Tax=Pyrenophora teres f. teres TaxID=97479 RepID=A0A6S6W693_9PLEO|nr:hypothetical protein PTNB29_08134 [Pyrenophora teres f. teres]CAE7187963.1 HET-domain-containing protein [Pyrenophora teres f. teres]